MIKSAHSLLLAMIGVAICLLFQCCNSFYATANPHVPVMDGKNDLNINLNGGFSGANAAASYSPLNHLYVGGTFHFFPNAHSYQKHFSGGPHLGYYYNSADRNFQFNAMCGYNWGSSNYANPFTGQDVSGSASYQSLHIQIAAINRIGKRKNRLWAMVVYVDPARLHYSHMNYHYNSHDSLASEIATAGCCFIFQHEIRKAPSFLITWQIGFQQALSNYGNPDDAIVIPMILRLGLIYHFHPHTKTQSTTDHNTIN